MKTFAPLFMLVFFALMAQPIFAQRLIPEPKVYKSSGTVILFKSIEAFTTVNIDTAMNYPSAEAYILKITPGSIRITAKSVQGVVWAKQTLKQLSVKMEQGILLPEAEIIDYPSYPMRGFMLDTGRNFMDVQLLKHYLDLLSLYKINIFHWHLTDHPGWRIECRAYPQLNDPRFQIKGRDEGRFCTYKEIREVIQYSKNLGITIIPEIDMPGHSAYFARAFGFKMDSKEGMEVLEKCLKEFFEEIPLSDTPYFHIGSDEVHIADPKGFMEWAEAVVLKAGRKPVAWDPGLPASENVIRQIWSDNASQQDLNLKGGKFLDSFMGYLNYFDPVVFTYRLILHQTVKSDKNLGGILCLWNDVNAADKNKIALHNGFLNGLLPFAERFWSGTDADYTGNKNLLPDPQSRGGKFISEFESRMIAHRDNLLKEEPFYWVSSSSEPWLVTEPVPAGADTAGIKWHNLWGGSIDLDAFAASLNIKPGAQMQLYARTYIHANADTVISAWIGFEAPARSNRISGGIGKEGEWENEGVVIVNGVKVNPPKWKEPGRYNFNFPTWARPEELLPYTDEQFYWMREPSQIQLKKGWNRIDVSAPKTFAGQMWSFSFTPLTYISPGQFREIKGIKFSVSK